MEFHFMRKSVNTSSARCYRLLNPHFKTEVCFLPTFSGYSSFQSMSENFFLRFFYFAGFAKEERFVDVAVRAPSQRCWSSLMLLEFCVYLYGVTDILKNGERSKKGVIFSLNKTKAAL